MEDSKRSTDYVEELRDNDAVRSSSRVNEKRKHYLEVENKNSIPKVLNLLHLIGALIQTAECIFLFAFSRNIHLKWLLFTHYPVAVEDSYAAVLGGVGADNLYYARPETRLVTEVSAPWVTGTIVLLSAIDHIFAIAPGGNHLYNHGLAQNRATYRWIEYGISCSLMNMHMAQLVGVTDVHMILMIFVLSILIQYPAYIFEVVNGKARADGYAYYWSPFFIGCLPYAAVWGVILTYYAQSLGEVEDQPGFVFPTIVAVFGLECLFPIVFVLQWMKIGIFRDYMVGEYTFMILGVIAKSSLAWLTIVGASKYAEGFRVENTDDLFY
mmetsp:Transcript_32924/g.79654  ORF Transcript_32924/g.79654 Transcript_32924/m.79654 type:complete len:325 (+) Transcript_32924:87-1061(+)|eukprot:CAMPEP_0113630416 /NCGR_PEP_ID=MMETSP0017_2-20120614/15802_1 /TAXON_ID=2856 /ORGANISM="Cylindrotheca closterium" /LENGTH=324 /DNA_ID=CAMNT_0000540877 /DNA_START=43 /DNA_END=1017 /DNA_ORIENTATION=- /assembly_acc=CAM_ASM_000147